MIGMNIRIGLYVVGLLEGKTNTGRTLHELYTEKDEPPFVLFAPILKEAKLFYFFVEKNRITGWRTDSIQTPSRRCYGTCWDGAQTLKESVEFSNWKPNQWRNLKTSVSSIHQQYKRLSQVNSWTPRHQGERISGSRSESIRLRSESLTPNHSLKCYFIEAQA